jgi:signal transduction histidine kinase
MIALSPASLGSIRRKLLGTVIATTAAALLVASGTLLALDLREYHRNWIKDIFTQMELLGRSSAAALQFDDRKVGQDNLSLLSIRSEFHAAALYDAHGKLFATYSRDGDTDFPHIPDNEGYRIDGGTIVAYKRIVEHDQILGTVYVQADYRLMANLFKGMGIVTLVIAMAMLVAMFVSGWLQSFLIDPILAIAGVAREVVTRRDFSLRARKLSNDEVGALADAFNAMLAEIQSRTDELETSNRELGREVAERRRVEGEVRRLNKELDSRVRQRTAELETANAELESFCYSVSHDLRAPLRSIDGFSQALTEELGGDISEDAGRYLGKIHGSTKRMGQLIEDLLNLSKLSRMDLKLAEVDLSAMAQEVVSGLQQSAPERRVDVSIWDGMKAWGDGRLLLVALENLLGNAWKFTGRSAAPKIEVGTIQEGGKAIYFVRDNGAGFDMAYVDKLFGVFQRLHGQSEFPGTGVGLATVQRIILRHGGRIWATATPGKGAAFFFTLPEPGEAGPPPAAGGETGKT